MTVDYVVVRAEGGGWRFEMEERDLTLIGVNYQTRLQFGPTEFVIESPFDIVVDETTHTLDPGERSRLGLFLPSTLTLWWTLPQSQTGSSN